MKDTPFSLVGPQLGNVTASDMFLSDSPRFHKVKNCDGLSTIREPDPRGAGASRIQLNH